jgi:multidrug efflux system membrane fusion protein
MPHDTHSLPRKSFLVAFVILTFLLVSLLFFGVYLTLNEENKISRYKVPHAQALILKNSQSIQAVRNYYGTLVPTKKVEIKPMVSGLVNSVHVTDGQYVEKGDLLFVIDDQNFQSLVEAFRGKLISLETNSKLIIIELDRLNKLLKNHQVSQNEIDTVKQRYRSLQGSIFIAQAEFIQAKIDLEYTRIYAPFSGRIGKISIHSGSMVSQEDRSSVFTILVSSREMFVEFHIEEDIYVQLNQILKAGSDIDPISIHAMSGNVKFSINSNNISFDNVVNSETGMMTVRGWFKNPNHALAPGMYADVILSILSNESHLIIPQKAVLSDYIGNYVYTLDNKHKAQKQYVKLRQFNSEYREVWDGLLPGDTIVISALHRLKSGKAVYPLFINGARPASLVSTNLH